MAGPGRGRDMRLTITACRMLYAGTNARGDAYTIWEIEAQNAQGQRIDEKLRSFEELPTGREIDVHVQVFESERHGKSYTVQPRGDKGETSLQTQLTKLNDEIVDLREQLATAMERVEALEQVARQPPAEGSTTW